MFIEELTNNQRINNLSYKDSNGLYIYLSKCNYEHLKKGTYDNKVLWHDDCNTFCATLEGKLYICSKKFDFDSNTLDTTIYNLLSNGLSVLEVLSLIEL